MPELFDLTGRVAVVTGCSTGLGRGMIAALAQAGADIVGIGRADASATAADVARADRRFHHIEADLQDASLAGDVIERAVDAHGSIDILVNNAGIIRRKDSLEFTQDDWDAVMDLNLKSLFFLSQAAAHQFVKQDTGGRIVNIASMLSYQGGIRVASYTASKSGVLGLTRLLAAEWAPKGINVNGIAPGYMETDNTEALRNDPVRNKEILGRIPAGRWGTPEDLGGAVVFLASDASRYVHGFTLAVDGGWLAR